MRWFPFLANSFQAFIYAIKVGASATFAFYFCEWIHLPEAAIWAAISVVVVIQPALHPSIEAAVTRMKANLIGALIGAAACSLLGTTPLAMGVGILAAGLFCHLAHLDPVLRSAHAAVIIIVFGDLTHPRPSTGSFLHGWHGSLERILAVVIGCASALLFTYLFDRGSRFLGVSDAGNGGGLSE